MKFPSFLKSKNSIPVPEAFTMLLPRVAASPEYADLLLRDVRSHHDVLIDGRRQVLTNSSFPRRIAAGLAERSPRSISVIGGSEDWMEGIRAAGEEFNLDIKFIPLPDYPGKILSH